MAVLVSFSCWIMLPDVAQIVERLSGRLQVAGARPAVRFEYTGVAQRIRGVTCYVTCMGSNPVARFRI